MRLLLTRPAADSAPLARELEAAGHRVLVAPLMAIEGLAGAALDLDGVQALLATSSNAVRAIAAHERAAAARALPLFAVGDATARSAREAGFGEVHAAGGDVEKLADLVREQLVPGNGRLVHVAGRERAGDLKGALAAQGFDVEVAVLYRAEAAGKLAAPVLAHLFTRLSDDISRQNRAAQLPPGRRSPWRSITFPAPIPAQGSQWRKHPCPRLHG